MSYLTFEREGLRLNAWDDGGAGLPVAFQHGLCGAESQPAEVFPAGDWRRLTLECRGHGASQVGDTQELSIATFTGDLAAFLEARGARPAVVGGISMGAAIALRLAVRRPDLVRALILARPAWVTETAPATMRPYLRAGELIAEDPAGAAARYEAEPIAAELALTAPDNLASARGFFTREPLAVTAALLRRISDDGPGVTRAEAAALRVPTLVIGHARDHVHPLAYAQDLARLIPGATLAEITPKATDKDAHAADVRRALRSFLERL